MNYNYSIILPYRDKYNLFVKAVRSIPDRKDIQIVVVDNAPIPLSEKDIPKKQRAHIVYTISSPSKGAGHARNIGLKHIEGKYILFLDGDDYFTPIAFDIFDKYLTQDFDIAFLKPTSLKLTDRSISKRHETYANAIDVYMENKNENNLRYRWEVPWSKLFRSDFVLTNNFQFDETPVSNDAWFSLMTGHYAHKIIAIPSVVYVVTEGGVGQSLVKTITKENIFIRYNVAIRINKFLKSVDHYDMRIRLLGFVHIALIKFGLKEFWRYLIVAYQNRIGFF